MDELKEREKLKNYQKKKLTYIRQIVEKFKIIAKRTALVVDHF